MTVELEYDKLLKEYPEFKSYVAREPASLESKVNQALAPIKEKKGVFQKLQHKFNNWLYDLDTTRYTKNKARLIIDKDDEISDAIGYLNSIPTKALLLSTKVGSYPSQKTIDYIAETVEKDQSLDGLTVRIGHQRVLKDIIRMFADKNITKRRSLQGRVILGLPNTVLGGIMAKLTRADHYNPYTHTIGIYSDIEAIAAHEIGHANDFEKSIAPAIYSFARILPPVMILQEYRASRYAHQNLPKALKTQTGRYLLPAFASYVGGLFSTPAYLATVAGGHIAGLLQRAYEKIKQRRENKKPHIIC